MVNRLENNWKATDEAKLLFEKLENFYKKKFKTDQQFILNAHFRAQMPSSFLVKNKHLVDFEI